MEEKMVTIQKIAPYIRYVNDKCFKSIYKERKRVLYDHEFIFGLSGEAIMRYGGEEYHIGRSDLFYLKPNINNQIFIEEGKSFHAHCVHFDWVFVDEQFDFTAEQYYMKFKFS